MNFVVQECSTAEVKVKVRCVTTLKWLGLTLALRFPRNYSLIGLISLGLG